MIDPPRLADGSDLRAQLLRSARRDVVPGAAKARNVAAVLASAGALYAKPAAAAGVASLLVKAAIVSALAVAAFGVHRYATSEDPSAAAPLAPRAPREATSTPMPIVLASPRATIPVPAPAPITSASVARPADPLAAATSSARLAEEVAQLDRARAKLLGGDGAGALGELAAYHREFPAAQLAREAVLLEIDALEKSGQHDRARQLARTFIRQHPQSPAASRLAATYD